MEAGQASFKEETKDSVKEMKAGQERMEAGQESVKVEMKAVQEFVKDEMKVVQESVKDEMKAVQETIEAGSKYGSREKKQTQFWFQMQSHHFAKENGNRAAARMFGVNER
ncbi:hypothetical protein X975_17241, partial [Stegodyphus mimosarum]